MSNINKQKLRQKAESATAGEWCAYIDSGTGTYAVHTPDDKRCENIINWPGFDCQQNAEANAKFIADANPATVLALLDENLQLQRDKDSLEAVVIAMRDDMRGAREKLEAAEKRIAELEESHVQVIQSRDHYKRMSEEWIKAIREARTVKLPDYSETYTTGFASEIEHQVRKVLEMAGVAVEGE